MMYNWFYVKKSLKKTGSDLDQDFLLNLTRILTHVLRYFRNKNTNIWLKIIKVQLYHCKSHQIPGKTTVMSSLRNFFISSLNPDSVRIRILTHRTGWNVSMSRCCSLTPSSPSPSFSPLCVREGKKSTLLAVKKVVSKSSQVDPPD